MTYYTYDYNYIYTGSVESTVSVSSATTTPPPSNLHIKYDPDTDTWNEIVNTLTLADLQTKELLNAKNYFDDLAAGSTMYDADFESASYQTQETEWRTWLVDTTAPTPYVDALATSRGITRDELMNKIGAKITYFGSFQGQLHALQDAIKATTTIDELNALVLPWR